MSKVLYFSADWCAPCQEMKPVVEQLNSDRLIKYDIDEAVVEREQYQVRAIPTFILVDENGVELDRVLGAISLDRLEELLR